MAPGFRRRGYHFVSHNYRLAPQARVDDQLADCLEAVSWCRAKLPSILGADKVDVDRYVLCGESAGGHLATLMGTRLSNPAPKAVIDVYGVVDFLTMRAFGPPGQRASRATQGPWTGKFSEEELNALLRDRDIANVVTDALSWNQFEFLTDTEISKLWATDFRYTDRNLKQAELHMMHSLSRSADGLHIGIMHSEKFANEEELMAFVSSVSPFRVLQRGVKEGKKGRDLYPPTAFLHGTGDVDVPIQQSYEMAKLLKDSGVPVVECYEEGEPHVFDLKYTVRGSVSYLFWRTEILTRSSRALESRDGTRTSSLSLLSWTSTWGGPLSKIRWIWADCGGVWFMASLYFLAPLPILGTYDAGRIGRPVSSTYVLVLGTGAEVSRSEHRNTKPIRICTVPYLQFRSSGDVAELVGHCLSSHR
jgi:acetyl esterase/lipase